MTLEPLTPVRTGSAADLLQIRCCMCNVQQAYGDAVRIGWTFGPDGHAYDAYYCATDTQRMAYP